MLARVSPKKLAAAPFVLVLLAISFLGAGQVDAQVAGATLSGTVKDPSGAVLPKAQISIRNVGTGVTRNLETDNAGLYAAPNLAPASYEISVVAPGFSTQVRTGITLTVGAQQELDFTMQVGQATQKVEVVGEAPTVELNSSALSAEVNATTVRELPLNGRSWTDLASLQPGVSQPNTQKPFSVLGRGQRGFGTQVSISGNRPDGNLYRLDGINVNDYANAAPSNVIGSALGVDAIQEFSVLTSNYPAQYGRATGGIFNAITRSGTNQFHGSAYEFLRNSALDARNFFDGPSPPPFKRNQFGAAGGGPIRKDRTFIFGDYEAIRQSLGISQIGTTLSQDARNGILHNADGSVTPVNVDRSVSRFIQAFYPISNGPILAPGNTATFRNTVQNIATEDFGTGRIDHKFSDTDSIDGVYLLDDSVTNTPDLQNSKVVNYTTRRQSIALEETHIFSPQTVNSLRLGFNRSVADVGTTPTAINPSDADPSFGGRPGANAPSVTVSAGLSNFTGGLGGTPFYLFHYNSYQIYDDAFMTKGRHSIKVGGSIERMQNNNQAVQGNNGGFTFGSLLTFLTNKPARFASALNGTISPRGIRESIFGVYVQDDWRLRRNLTLNLGLRYETATVPTEVQGKLSNILQITDAQPHLGSPFFSNFTRHNFEPRIGFAWDPFGNGKTAVRGGFGMYDMEPLPYEFFLGTATVAPFFAQGSTSDTTLLAGTFPSNAYPFVAGNPKTFKYSHVEPNASRRYVMQWNLNVQRQIVPNLTVMIGYVGSRGLHLPFHMDDMDIVLPKLTSAGYVWPFPASSTTRLNPNVGVLVGELMVNHSWYDAAQFQVTKTLSRGLQMQASYTWGKNIDYSSGTFAGDAFGNGITSLPWIDNQLNRGLADFNISQNLVINGIWIVPAPKSASGFGKWALDGWQLGSIFKANSGVPFTPNWGTGGDPLGLNSSDPFDVPDRLADAGCSSLINPGNPTNYIKTQCFAVPTAPSAAFYAANCDPTRGTFPQCFNLRGNAGRNILIGPGLTNLDFSLFKNNYIRRISESFNAQFRVEFFNVLNHANFGLPASSAIFDSRGASIGASDLITSTQTPSRQLQFALKLTW